MIHIKFNIKDIIISYNSFDDIINLSNYNDIVYIDCGNNQLTIKYNGNIQQYNTDLQLHNK